MAKPVRVQLSRKKGWRMPANTAKVDRSTGYGNPWSVYKHPMGNWVVNGPDTPTGGFQCGNEEGARLKAIALYREEITRLGAPEELAGKNLACWCPLDKPCHADVLLELANASPPSPSS